MKQDSKQSLLTNYYGYQRFPLAKLRKKKMAKIDRQTVEIDGVKFTNTHSGQKQRYGDSFYDYEVISDLPPDEVLRVLQKHARECKLPRAEYLKDLRERPSMENSFRSSYEFKKVSDGKFFYSVMFPYTD